jgi:hypothetical protein
MTDVMVRRFARWPVRPNWVLVDQCIVSGSKFAASVLVARFLGPDMFGTFVLMLAAQLYANARMTSESASSTDSMICSANMPLR